MRSVMLIQGQLVRRYGLHLSGHSLGAGCAAVATDLLRRHPERFPTLFASLEAARVTCFCAAAPPVFSLDIARAASAHTTTVTLGHDVVARASVANLEQLRLEVLSSGWWTALIGSEQQNAAAARASSTLTAVGAGALALLASTGSSSGGGGAAGGAAGASRSLDVENAIATLRHLYVTPTVRTPPSTPHNCLESVSRLMHATRSASQGEARAAHDLLSRTERATEQLNRAGIAGTRTAA